jgi:hypothetical protein
MLKDILNADAEGFRHQLTPRSGHKRHDWWILTDSH